MLTARDVVPNIFEPTPRFSRGTHKALEVDVAQLDALRDALAVARQLGDAGPIVALINDRTNVTLSAAEFFESPDRYPACANLTHYIPRIVRRDGASQFGLDVLGEIYAGELAHGAELIDVYTPISPAWLSAAIELPFRVETAASLLASTDFTSGIDQDAVGRATEAFDLGELGDDISGVGDFQVDALDDWAARLRDALDDYQLALQDIAARDGTVLTWYDRS